jgi:hypothetical protein
MKYRKLICLVESEFRGFKFDSTVCRQVKRNGMQRNLREKACAHGEIGQQQRLRACRNNPSHSDTRPLVAVAIGLQINHLPTERNVTELYCRTIVFD